MGRAESARSARALADVADVLGNSDGYCSIEHLSIQ